MSQPSIEFSFEIHKKVREIVYECDVETGVTLFGKKVGEVFRITDVCGPGPIATHEVAHYSGDNDYASFVYENLLKADPELKHMGELHTHPFGMRRLSKGDRETVQEVLKTYEEFVAGVMLRYRGDIEVYPVYFSREIPEGKEMEVLYVESHRGHWPWIWRRRRGGHAGKGRGRKADPGGPGQT